MADYKRAKPTQFGVIGDFFIDVQAGVPSIPQWNADVETPAIEVLPGGSSCNTARQLAALVQKVKFFSTCSNDLLGSAILSQLEGQGFDTCNMKRLSLPSSACIVLSGPQDRAMVSCYSTVKALTCEQIHGEELCSCSHVHVGGYLGATGLHTETFTELIKKCREGGASISLGTNADPSGKWTGEGDHIRTLLPHVDLFICNEEELCSVTKAMGQPLCELVSTLTVVETCGPEGSKVHTKDGVAVHAPAPALKDPIDFTGAGDAFAAGFLAKWTSGDRSKSSLITALEWGNSCAVCCIRRRGACAEPIAEGEVRSVHQQSYSD